MATGIDVLSLLPLLLAGGYLLLYRVKVVVTADGVIHRPLLATRLVPWGDIRKVDQVSRLGVGYVRFWTSRQLVQAARPSEVDHQRIMAMRDEHRLNE